MGLGKSHTPELQLSKRSSISSETDELSQEILNSEIRHLIRPRRYMVLITSAITGVICASIAGISLGAVALPISDIWQVIAAHLLGGTASDPITDSLVWDFRTPRVLLALIVGAGLAVAGATLQAVVRNPLADPYILGVSSGASAGAVAVLTLGSAAVAGLSVSAAAFIGAMASLALVLLFGQRAGKLNPTRLVLAGVAIGYLLAAITSYLQLRADPDRLAGVLFWLMGSLSSASWDQLGVPAACVVACTLLLIAQGKRINLLLLGEESATSLGINVRLFRLQLLIISALLTGTVVAVAGGVGFVGLMIPHIVRMLVGPDHRRLLPLTALAGAAYLAIVDIAARTIDRPLELPLGVLTAVVGVPFLLWLLRRDRLPSTAA